MKTKSSIFKTFFYILITGLVLSSCSKDKSSDNDIIGTWTAGTTTFSATVGNQTLIQYFTQVMGLTAEEAQQYQALFELMITQSVSGTLTIKSNNTYTSTLGGSDDSGTWALSADGKKLTIDSTIDGPTILDVKSLTGSKMVVEISEVSSEDLNGDDIPELLSIIIGITFTK